MVVVISTGGIVVLVVVGPECVCGWLGGNLSLEGIRSVDCHPVVSIVQFFPLPLDWLC